MKKLVEAEKAKLRLADVINNMKDETDKYFYAYLIKNKEVRICDILSGDQKIVKLQAFIRGRLTKIKLSERMRMFQLTNKIGKKAEDRYNKIYKEMGIELFKRLLYDKNGNKIPLKSKKTNTSKKTVVKKPETGKFNF